MQGCRCVDGKAKPLCILLKHTVPGMGKGVLELKYQEMGSGFSQIPAFPKPESASYFSLFSSIEIRSRVLIPNLTGL